jgi:hypothetical protein
MNKVDMTDTYWIAREAERGRVLFSFMKFEFVLPKSPSATAADDVMGTEPTPIRRPGEGRQLEIDRQLPLRRSTSRRQGAAHKKPALSKKDLGQARDRHTHYELQSDQR